MLAYFITDPTPLRSLCKWECHWLWIFLPFRAWRQPLFLQIHMVFMLCSLLRTSKLAGSMGFLITFLFGCLSLAVLIENLPEPLKWFLGLFCPFAFNAGIAKVWGIISANEPSQLLAALGPLRAILWKNPKSPLFNFCPLFQVFHLEKYGIGFSFSNLMEESYFLFSTYIMLIFDSVLYMLLAMYFDKVLPGKSNLYLWPYFPLL